MEWFVGFLKRLTANVIAAVAITIGIFLAPVISLAVVVGIEYHPEWADLAGWFVFACPFCVGIWYMFVASLTRYARAKHFGVSPREGFLWAGCRLFGGWFLSQAAILLLLFFGGLTDLRTAVVWYLLVAWSPVLVNLLRHFMRGYPVSSTSAPCPVASR